MKPSTSEELAALRHLGPLLLSDADIEYGVLFMVFGDTDWNTAAQAIFDMKGISDPTLREQIWHASHGNKRMGQLWADMNQTRYIHV